MAIVGWVASFAVIVLAGFGALIVHASGIGFALGLIVGAGVYNVVHRIQYGSWL